MKTITVLQKRHALVVEINHEPSLSAVLDKDSLKAFVGSNYAAEEKEISTQSVSGQFPENDLRSGIRWSIEVSDDELAEFKRNYKNTSVFEIKFGKLQDEFPAALFKLIDSKGKTDSFVYKRARMSRQLFSKIRKGGAYTPTKRTVLSLVIALELSLKEAELLLGSAGYALSHSSKTDVIIEFFISQSRYNITEINEALYEFDEPILG